jgi:hypothetical protein
MKIASVLLLTSLMMLLPHILESFNVSTQYLHSNIAVYAQNSTSDKSSITTGTPEKGLPPVSLHPLPKSQQFQILHKKPVPLLSVLRSQTYKKGSRIALIVPVFTGAAYNYAFYIFYKHYANVRAGENVTHHLFLLSSLLTKPKLPKIPNYPAIAASAYAMRYLDISDILTYGRYLRRTEPIREKHSKQPQIVYRIGFSNRCSSIVKYSAYRKHLCRYEIILNSRQ